MILASVRTSQELRRILRFAIVGVSGTLLDFTLLVLCKELLGLATLLANPLAFVAGVINNFLLNRTWTYPESRSRSVWSQLGQFIVVSLGGVLLNTGLVLLLEQPLGTLLHMPDSGYLPAKIIATGIVFFWNFYANRRWTFGDVQ